MEIKLNSKLFIVRLVVFDHVIVLGNRKSNKGINTYFVRLTQMVL